MRKIAVSLLALSFASIAQAKDYGAAGCGVGTIIFEGQSGLGPHVLAATTNGFYGTQTFAMTSGTLGCDVNGTITSHTAHFIDSNMDNLARDISRGEGETLDALASVMGVKSSDKAQFSSILRSGFSEIYSGTEVTSQQVFERINTVLESNTELSKYSA